MDEIDELKKSEDEFGNPFTDLFPKLEHGRRWGIWELDTKSLTLFCRHKEIYVEDIADENYDFQDSNEDSENDAEPDDEDCLYWIPIGDITTSAKMLDWIIQIKKKSFFEGKDVSDLIDAFDDLFNPQGTLCSAGEHKVLADGKEFLRKRFA